MKPVVVIIGRPNVGKSTFFNMLAGSRTAIVEDQPGVTRDLNYADVKWRSTSFWLVDSGGYDTISQDMISTEIRSQLLVAMDEADLLLFMLDGKDGPTKIDEEIYALIRRQEKPVMLVINKCDNDRLAQEANSFYELGIDQFYPISSKNKYGMRSMMDQLIELFPGKGEGEVEDREAERPCRIAFIGRPNVGKSSLVNALCGYKRVVVADTPGTTRDAIEIPFEHDKIPYVLIDTAGIRRKAKVSVRIETYGVVRALRALDQCDIALIVIDGSAEPTVQDERIAGYAHQKGRGCILVVNKWDLAKKGRKPIQEYEKELRYRFGFLSYAPIVFVSALKNKGMDKITEATALVRQNRARRISTGKLNDWLEKVLIDHNPPMHHGRRLKIYYMTQSHINPPTFVAFANYPEAIHFSYSRYLNNKIRDLGDFDGSPIWLKFRKRSENKEERLSHPGKKKSGGRNRS